MKRLPAAAALVGLVALTGAGVAPAGSATGALPGTAPLRAGNPVQFANPPFSDAAHDAADPWGVGWDFNTVEGSPLAKFAVFPSPEPWRGPRPFAGGPSPVRPARLAAGQGTETDGVPTPTEMPALLDPVPVPAFTPVDTPVPEVPTFTPTPVVCPPAVTPTLVD